MSKTYKEFLRKVTTEDIINKMDENVNEVLNPKIGDKLKHKFKNVNYDVEIVGMNTNASNLQLKLISNGPDKGRTITVQRDKIKEDAPANAVGTGANVALPPEHEPGVKKKKKKDLVMGTLKRNVQENNDNNNVVIKGILDKLDKLEEAIDKASGIVKQELEFVEEKEYKSFKDKYAKDI